MSRSEDVLVLRCLAYPKSQRNEPGYLAQCIDLDLTVWRPDLEESVDALNEQIVGYFDSIQTKNEFEQLVPRPAPFFPYRARYYSFVLLGAIPVLLSRLSSTIYEWSRPRDELLQRVGA